jgi:hypothetical protein
MHRPQAGGRGAAIAEARALGTLSVASRDFNNIVLAISGNARLANDDYQPTPVQEPARDLRAAARQW